MLAKNGILNIDLGIKSNEIAICDKNTMNNNKIDNMSQSNFQNSAGKALLQVIEENESFDFEIGSTKNGVDVASKDNKSTIDVIDDRGDVPGVLGVVPGGCGEKISDYEIYKNFEVGIWDQVKGYVTCHICGKANAMKKNGWGARSNPNGRLSVRCNTCRGAGTRLLHKILENNVSFHKEFKLLETEHAKYMKARRNKPYLQNSLVDLVKKNNVSIANRNKEVEMDSEGPFYDDSSVTKRTKRRLEDDLTSFDKISKPRVDEDPLKLLNRQLEELRSQVLVMEAKLTSNQKMHDEKMANTKAMYDRQIADQAFTILNLEEEILELKSQSSTAKPSNSRKGKGKSTKCLSMDKKGVDPDKEDVNASSSTQTSTENSTIQTSTENSTGGKKASLTSKGKKGNGKALPKDKVSTTTLPNKVQANAAMPSKKTYADAAKSDPKKVERSYFTPWEKKTPQIFKRICMEYYPEPSVRKQGFRGMLRSVFRELDRLKIRHLVKEVSLIGFSVVEMYVADICFAKVMSNLQLKKAVLCTPSISRTITDDKCRQKIVNRIGFLLKRNSIKNLRECILDGFDTQTINMCLAKEKELSTSSNPSKRGNEHHKGKNPLNDASLGSKNNGSCL
jgi:hypothetical protein